MNKNLMRMRVSGALPPFVCICIACCAESKHHVSVADMGAFSAAYERALARREQIKFRKIEIENPPTNKFLCDDIVLVIYYSRYSLSLPLLAP
jgi:hypothetical protein